ncbi:MAG: hypothetical protein Ct9H300mP1_25210 [Planctomycetaceae bacterium]|nr:MAG: hypothetical protein Ct9H300mP1_25210 [Planctomycetaceae bacterium]
MTCTSRGTGLTVVAENERTGRLMGSCFYHPREHHVSLGIMTVHPNYFGHGVGSALLRHIIEFTESNNYGSLRLTQSALNLIRSPLQPVRFCPQVFPTRTCCWRSRGASTRLPVAMTMSGGAGPRCRAMAELEMSVRDHPREDYRYCIENELDIWSVSVCENRWWARWLDGQLRAPGHEHAGGPVCPGRGDGAH